jgi:hypothetical protein
LEMEDKEYKDLRSHYTADVLLNKSTPAVTYPRRHVMQ